MADIRSTEIVTKTKLLTEIATQLTRIADVQERLATQIERDTPERHRELMTALGEILAQLDKIERTPYG